MTCESDAFRIIRVQADDDAEAKTVTATMQCDECGERGPTIKAPKQPTPAAQDEATLEAQRVAGAWVGTHRKEERQHVNFRIWLGIPFRVSTGERE